MRRPYVLVTRPREAAEETAARVAQKGYNPLTEPLLTIHPCNDMPCPDFGRYQALVFTSARACRILQTHGWKLPYDMPVYAVGPRTAQAARDVGFQNVTAGGGTVADLNAHLAEEIRAEKPLLHFAGEDIAAPVTAGDRSVERVVLYKAAAADSLSESCLAALDEGLIAAALFFSPRTGRIFTDLIGTYGRTAALESIQALCLSDSVVKSVAGLPWRDVRVTDTPAAEAMYDLLAQIK